MALNFSIAEFADLVKKAHGARSGLHSIECDLVDPNPSALGVKVAIVKASVQMQSGETFTAHGSAEKGEHGYTIVEVAERRAKILALIEATNSAEMLEQADFKPNVTLINPSDQYAGQ